MSRSRSSISTRRTSSCSIACSAHCAAKPRDKSRPPSPNLIAVSISLNAGIYNVLFGLRAGAPIVVMDGFEPAVFAELVRRFEIRSTVLPPAAMTMLADDPLVEDLTPLKYVRSITAPLSPIQARRFTDKFGVTVLNGYGQAEIGEVIGWTAADAREHPEKVGAVGRPHPGVAIKVIDDTGADAGPDVVGRLLVRPPSMASGYADGAELADRIDAEGFVDTGDLARIDPEGFVWIEGRVGDVINRGGNKVFPDHVAEVLRLVPGVIDAGVVGVPDDRLGAVPVAFVVAATRRERRRSAGPVSRAPCAVQGPGRVPPGRLAAAQPGRQAAAQRPRRSPRRAHQQRLRFMSAAATLLCRSRTSSEAWPKRPGPQGQARKR